MVVFQFLNVCFANLEGIVFDLISAGVLGLFTLADGRRQRKSNTTLLGRWTTGSLMRQEMDLGN